MNLTVIGLGYVGLTTGLGLAALGHSIYGIEINQHYVKLLKEGKLPFYEEDLEKVLKKCLNKSFFLLSDLSFGFKHTTVIIICVGTPATEDGAIDLRYVNSVIEQLAILLKDSSDYKLIVIKSTVIPGTTRDIGEQLKTLSGKKLGVEFDLAMVPEFLREGFAFNDFLHPDRMIFGVLSSKAQHILEDLYRSMDCP